MTVVEVCALDTRICQLLKTEVTIGSGKMPGVQFV